MLALNSSRRTGAGRASDFESPRDFPINNDYRQSADVARIRLLIFEIERLPSTKYRFGCLEENGELLIGAIDLLRLRLPAKAFEHFEKQACEDGRDGNARLGWLEKESLPEFDFFVSYRTYPLSWRVQVMTEKEQPHPFIGLRPMRPLLATKPRLLRSRQPFQVPPLNQSPPAAHLRQPSRPSALNSDLLT